MKYCKPEEVRKFRDKTFSTSGTFLDLLSPEFCNFLAIPFLSLIPCENELR